MKAILGTIAAALLLSLPAYADDAHHPGQKAGAAPAARAAAATAPEAGAPLQKMRANVKKMDAQLARIGKAKNDEERHRLLAEHMQTMRDNMMLGKEMAEGEHCSMMEGGMGMPGQRGMGVMEQGGGMTERMQQMEKRMDMMQMMIEQMGKAQPMPTPAR